MFDNADRFLLGFDPYGGFIMTVNVWLLLALSIAVLIALLLSLLRARGSYILSVVRLCCVAALVSHLQVVDFVSFPAHPQPKAPSWFTSGRRVVGALPSRHLFEVSRALLAISGVHPSPCVVDRNFPRDVCGGFDANQPPKRDGASTKVMKSRTLSMSTFHEL